MNIIAEFICEELKLSQMIPDTPVMRKALAKLGIKDYPYKKHFDRKGYQDFLTKWNKTVSECTPKSSSATSSISLDGNSVIQHDLDQLD